MKRKRETKETKSGDVTMANSDEETEAHKVISPAKYPDDIQKRRMLSKTVKIMIIGMENMFTNLEMILKSKLKRAQ